MSFAVVNMLPTEHLAYHCVAGVFLTLGYLARRPDSLYLTLPPKLNPDPNPTLTNAHLI